ncbi:MAG: zinc ribbon domain-containing protein [Lachnospiraceae bacterium]|nr:zinc ribbon domain-containing protein [Lachnospiraceae bacterium]
MKCPSCGANLQIEDERCPFCGKENPFAAKHRSDMYYYDQEFHKTRQAVEQKTNLFTMTAVKISVIAVLAVLNLGMFYLVKEGPYEIWKWQVHRDIQTHLAEYDSRMEKYEKEGNWEAINAFYNEKELHMDENFREYSILYYASGDYGYVLSILMNYSEENEYTNAEYSGSRIAQILDDFYACADRTNYESEYYDACYTGEHREALMHLKTDMEAILMAYANLTEEEVKALPDYSETKKKSLIMEGLQR